MSLENSEYSFWLLYAKFPAYWHMEMPSKCWVIICCWLMICGFCFFNFQLQASLHGFHIKTNGDNNKKTGQKGKECGLAVYKLYKTKRLEISCCFVAIKDEMRQRTWQCFDKLKLSNKFLICCYEMTRHREIFQIHHTLDWSSLW